MRSILLVVAITLAGCGSDGNQTTQPDLAVSVDMNPVTACATRCTLACIGGATCVTGDDFSPTCLKPCTDSRDCASGSQCANLTGGAPAGRWCIDPTTPAHCGIGCAVGPGNRCEGNVAVHGGGFQAYCATQYEYCAHGCATPDGGTVVMCNP